MLEVTDKNVTYECKILVHSSNLVMVKRYARKHCMSEGAALASILEIGIETLRDDVRRIERVRGLLPGD